MSGANEPVILLANATGGCGIAPILPQGAGRKALRNHGAWPIHGDRTLLDPPICAPASVCWDFAKPRAEQGDLCATRAPTWLAVPGHAEMSDFRLVR
jgi:hypothetical protein